MSDAAPDLAKALQRFLEHMPTGDDVTLVVLKGHLILEEHLDQVIAASVSHPKYLEKADLTFYRKWLLARSMCWDWADSDMWDLIVSVNGLRNELAHKLEAPAFAAKLQEIMAKYSRSMEAIGGGDTLGVMHEQSAASQLRYVIVYLMGFLSRFSSDAKTVMHTIRTMRNAKEAVLKELRVPGEPAT